MRFCYSYLTFRGLLKFPLKGHDGYCKNAVEGQKVTKKAGMGVEAVLHITHLDIAHYAYWLYQCGPAYLTKCDSPDFLANSHKTKLICQKHQF